MDTRTGKSGELSLIRNKLLANFGSIVFFSFIINIGALLPAFYTIQVLDRVLSSRSVYTLAALSGLMLFLLVVIGVLGFVRSRQLARLANRLDKELGPRVFDVMFRIGLEQPTKTSLQPLDDLTTLRETLVSSGPIAVLDAPWIPVFYLVLFIIHPWIGVTAVAFGVIVVLVALLNNMASKGAASEARAEGKQSRDFFVNSLRNADAIYAMGMAPALRLRWLQTHLGALAARGKGYDKTSAYGAVISSIRGVARIVVISVAAYLVLKLEMTPGLIIAAMIISGRALGPLQTLVNNWQRLIEAKMAYSRLAEILDQYPPQSHHILLPAPLGTVSAEGIFAGAATQKSGEQPILKGVSFHLDPGETLAILGQNGAGKSTLARVILGIWPILAGTVRLDGNDVRNWDPLQFGRYVGYLPQDVQLFNGTVAENIARFGKVRSRKVVAAAKLAGAHDLILNFGKGYMTQIGPGGSTLSAGQRQRIALARALYDLPRVVVLDEPNSNLDEEGEAALMNALDSLKKLGTTLIFIAHRRRILEKADKVLILTKGQVRHFGMRDEFLRRYMPGLLDVQAESRQDSLEGPIVRSKPRLEPPPMEGRSETGKNPDPQSGKVVNVKNKSNSSMEIVVDEEELNTESLMKKWRPMNAA